MNKYLYQSLLVVLLTPILCCQAAYQDASVDGILELVPPTFVAGDPFLFDLEASLKIYEKDHDLYIEKLKRFRLRECRKGDELTINKNLLDIANQCMNDPHFWERMDGGISHAFNARDYDQALRRFSIYYDNDYRVAWEFYFLAPYNEVTHRMHYYQMPARVLMKIGSIYSAPVFHQKLYANSRYLEKRKSVVESFKHLDFQDIFDYFTIHTREEDLAEIFIWAHDFDTKFPQLEDANAGLGMGSQLVYEMLITEVKGNFPWQATIEKYRLKAIPDKQTKVLTKADDFIKSVLSQLKTDQRKQDE